MIHLSSYPNISLKPLNPQHKELAMLLKNMAQTGVGGGFVTASVKDAIETGYDLKNGRMLDALKNGLTCALKGFISYKTLRPYFSRHLSRIRAK
jgi:hypothetical protein